MNQIICTSNSDLGTSKTYTPKTNYFKIQFLILVIISISITLYYLLFRYDLYKAEKLSRDLIDNFNISTLYSSNSDYSGNLITQEVRLSDGSTSHVVGIIEIKKIDIIYPILSEINKDFLKISPCRFYGPNPNEIGNLCIAAHNYKNGTFFSNLSDLSVGDLITIYDTAGKSVDYIIYNVYTSDAHDLECINQNTNNKKIVTLITCNSLNNSYRTIVKAKEI